MIHKRIAGRKRVRSHPVPTGARQVDQGVHPVTNHESFSHSVLFAGAHQWHATTRPLLQGRSHTDPTKKPHEHQNQPRTWHLDRGAHVRPGLGQKNV